MPVIADYQLVGPARPGAWGGWRWATSAPGRLGPTDGWVTIVELDGVADEEWLPFLERLAELAAIRHPRLAGLVEAGRGAREDGSVRCWVAVDGHPATGDDRPVGRDDALRAAASLARAAHELHEGGQVHGGIGPASLSRLEGVDGLVLVPPIGRLGRNADATGGIRRPEDLDGVDPAVLWGEGHSRTSDIWSLGALVQLLLAGRGLHPALADDPITTAVGRILHVAPALAPGLDPDSAALIGSCLASDPAERPPTAAALADALDALVR